MKNNPKFEVWGWLTHPDDPNGVYCLKENMAYAEATKVAAKYRSQCQTAFIVDKKTGKRING